MIHNLLREPLLRVSLRDGRRDARTLPGALAELTTGEIVDFAALQAHQQHAWHAFCVQLAAIALHRAGRSEPPSDESTWVELLLALTGGREEPWCLVVADLSRPAFFQPPVPEGTLKGFGRSFSTPDGLDVLVTAKNHDVKLARSRSRSPEMWVYALASLQTMAGYSGPKNYEIARMNRGYGSRPCVAFVPSLSAGSRFRRDVELLLRAREDLVGSLGYADDGPALLYLLPWDGSASIPLSACDPFFVEVARRIRLVEGGRALSARMTGTAKTRLDAKEANGCTGDPWTPVKLDDPPKALSLAASGYSYRLAWQLLLTANWRLGAAAEATGAESVFVLQGLARGQGVTNGYHERRIPIPASRRQLLGHPSERERLAALARSRVDDAARVQRKVLRPALCALLQGDPGKLDLRDERSGRWLQALDAEIDAIFFPALWRDAERPAAEAQQSWWTALREGARSQLEDAFGSAPVPHARWYRAVSAAERLFAGAFRKHFPLIPVINLVFHRRAAAVQC